MIGILVPGAPIYEADTLSSNTIIIDVINPKSIDSVSMFQYSPLPDINFCSVLYYITPTGNNLSYMGYISNSKQSENFTTGWRKNQNVFCYDSIKLVVQNDTLQNILNKYGNYKKEAIDKKLLKEAARDALNSLMSSNMVNNNNSQNILIKEELLQDDIYELLYLIL